MSSRHAISFADAQSRYDAMPPPDENYTDDEPVIAEMLAEPDCFDNWLSGLPLPSSVAGLLSLILDRGLPIMDKSETDDALRDTYEVRIQSVRDDFAGWAMREERGEMCPVAAWKVNA